MELLRIHSLILRILLLYIYMSYVTTGAQAMIDDGLFERFPMEYVFGMHNMPGLCSVVCCNMM